ncbi:MAG: hypothetical protein HYZ08_02820 [Candidatus Kerfeldbacteria bacterium]|nr:hypothetical protein [Candidatus Kerfeldbacteria bacterium]
MRDREALARRLQPQALSLSLNQIIDLVMEAGFPCRIVLQVAIGEGVGFEKQVEHLASAKVAIPLEEPKAGSP